MSGRWSDPGWWPTPPPRPAASGTQLAGAVLVPLVAAVLAVALVLGSRHSEPKATSCAPAQAACTPETPAAAADAAPAKDAREAFRQCLGTERPAGATRFSRPSKSFRLRFELCRSLAAGGASQPASPPATTTTPAAPIA